MVHTLFSGEEDSSQEIDSSQELLDQQYLDLLLKVKNKDHSIESTNFKFFESDESHEIKRMDEDEKMRRMKKVNEYFGDEAELDADDTFLKAYLGKQIWKVKDRKIDETELQILKQEMRDDKVAIQNQKDYEARNNGSGILMRINTMLTNFEGGTSKKAKRKGREKRVIDEAPDESAEYKECKKKKKDYH